MKTKSMFLAIAGLFLAAGVSAQSAPAPADSTSGKHQRAAKLDKDGDGAISREEANSKKRLAANFDALDVNKDGKVSKEELQAGRKRTHDEHAARVKAADTDGDGALSKAEAQAGKLPGLVKHFDKLDANKDGKIGPDEMHAKKGKPQDHRGSTK